MTQSERTRLSTYFASGDTPAGYFRGRPPFLPFCRAAACFSSVFATPPFLPFRRAAAAFRSDVCEPARERAAFFGWIGASVRALCFT